MTLPVGSESIGTKRTVALTGAIVLFLSTTALAQDPVVVDPDVFNLFLESSIKKPVAQATQQERTAAMNQLTDIILVTDLPRAMELGDEPQLKAQLELQRRILVYKAFASDFVANNQATDQEIFNLYAEQVALAPPKEFKARHILVESQSVALGLVQELQDGADFIELAKSKSTGPSGPNGGDLGWFQSQQMVKPFSDAVAALEDGAFTTVPVQTQYGWHVILREASRDSTPPTLESVRDVIKQRVEQEKLQKYISSLRQSSSE